MFDLWCVVGGEVEVVDRNGPFSVGSAVVTTASKATNGTRRRMDACDAALTDAEDGVAAI